MEAMAKPAHEMSTDELVEFLEEANSAYRRGEPIIEDGTYDHVYIAELKKREPDHDFLNTVESDTFSGDKVQHSTPMLSTDKAYTQEETEAFVRRVIKAAASIGIKESEITFSITAKLDGMAGKYVNNILATRGNGLTGNNITRNFDRGLVAVGGENTGVGEIVILKSYFEENLSGAYSHPRNFVTGLIGADTLSKEAEEALQDEVVRFVPYSELTTIVCNCDELSTKVEQLCEEIEQECVYPVDGSVINVVNQQIRDYMGSTSHHNNWQLAKKTAGETATSKVIGVSWQTGRTGRITPVINIETTNLSGANLSNVTGHHAGNIKNLNVGVGAVVRIIRSGEVIPHLLGVVDTGMDAVIPEACPTCGEKAVMEKDFLVCHNEKCSAKKQTKLVHFFNTIGNVDLFGPKTIEVLIDNNYTELADIYQLQANDFEQMGFGEKQSSNLVEQLERSRTEAVEDWRFLAAQGIPHLGQGDSRKLLKKHKIETLNEIDASNIIEIPGFGEITSESISESLRNKWVEIAALLSMGFNLVSDNSDQVESPIKGMNVVFTGAMESNRDEMKNDARKLGANVQSSVNKKTDMLIIGQKVGATKIQKAESLGTKVVTEAEYRSMAYAQS